MTNEEKAIARIAESTSFDLDNQKIIITFKDNVTKLPFRYVKNIYFQIVKLEEHLIQENK